MADPLDLLMAGIARKESGGNYGAMGPATGGDRAYGKYQVMGANVPQWTREALGQSMTPLEFLHSPQAQEAVARAKLGSYMQQYGPVGAANAWFTGSPHPNPKSADVLGTTAANYASQTTAGIPNTVTHAPPPGATTLTSVPPTAATAAEPGIGSGIPTPAAPNSTVAAAEPGIGSGYPTPAQPAGRAAERRRLLQEAHHSAAADDGREGQYRPAQVSAREPSEQLQAGGRTAGPRRAPAGAVRSAPGPDGAAGGPVEPDVPGRVSGGGAAVIVDLDALRLDGGTAISWARNHSKLDGRLLWQLKAATIQFSTWGCSA